MIFDIDDDFAAMTFGIFTDKQQNLAQNSPCRQHCRKRSATPAKSEAPPICPLRFNNYHGAEAVRSTDVITPPAQPLMPVSRTLCRISLLTEILLLRFLYYFWRRYWFPLQQELRHGISRTSDFWAGYFMLVVFEMLLAMIIGLHAILATNRRQNNAIARSPGLSLAPDDKAFGALLLADFADGHASITATYRWRISFLSGRTDICCSGIFRSLKHNELA